MKDKYRVFFWQSSARNMLEVELNNIDQQGYDIVSVTAADHFMPQEFYSATIVGRWREYELAQYLNLPLVKGEHKS